LLFAQFFCFVYANKSSPPCGELLHPRVVAEWPAADDREHASASIIFPRFTAPLAEFNVCLCKCLFWNYLWKKMTLSA
jgi:hypothetical protein